MLTLTILNTVLLLILSLPWILLLSFMTIGFFKTEKSLFEPVHVKSETL